jgi:hypothetical protein
LNHKQSLLYIAIYFNIIEIRNEYTGKIGTEGTVLSEFIAKLCESKKELLCFELFRSFLIAKHNSNLKVVPFPY